MRRLIKHPVLGPRLIGLGAFLLRLIVRGLGRTLRVRVLRGQEHLDALHEAPRPILISYWHNRTFLAADFVLREIHAKGLEITLFASQSRDGELVTQTARPWGLHTVRGSATRGGMRAIRALYRAINQRGTSPVMIPDGPQGPLYHFKLGVAVLSQMSDAPILPIGLAADRFWRIRSWDRLIIPKPFSRVDLVLGPLQTVERGLSEEALEARRLELQKLIDDLTLEAEASAGVEDEARALLSTTTKEH